MLSSPRQSLLSTVPEDIKISWAWDAMRAIQKWNYDIAKQIICVLIEIDKQKIRKLTNL